MGFKSWMATHGTGVHFQPKNRATEWRRYRHSVASGIVEERKSGDHVLSRKLSSRRGRESIIWSASTCRSFLFVGVHKTEKHRTF